MGFSLCTLTHTLDCLSGVGMLCQGDELTVMLSKTERERQVARTPPERLPPRPSLPPRRRSVARSVSPCSHMQTYCAMKNMCSGEECVWQKTRAPWHTESPLVRGTHDGLSMAKMFTKIVHDWDPLLLTASFTQRYGQKTSIQSSWLCPDDGDPKPCSSKLETWTSQQKH